MTKAEKWMLCVTVAIALFTAIGSIAAWYTIHVTLRQYAEDIKDKTETDWEAVEIYKILEENRGQGMSLSDIGTKYTADALKTEDVHLEKKKLQDQEIRRVLLTLMQVKLVYQTLDDKYGVAKSELIPNGFQSFNVNRATGSIAMELAKEGGRTPEQLAKTVPEEAKVTPEDYWTAIDLMIANGGNWRFYG